MAGTVLTTRPGLVGEALHKELQALGVKSVYLPAMEILPYTNGLSADEMKQSLLSAEMIVVISANAVRFCEMLVPEITRKTPIFVIGEATRKVLVNDKAYDHNIIFCPEDFTSEGLLQLEQWQDVKEKNIALICGVGGRELLEQELITKGGVVTRIECYQRHYPAKKHEAELQRRLLSNHIDAVVITSGEALENMLKMSGSQLALLLKLQLIVISQRIATIAASYGFEKPAIVIKNADNVAIVRLLTKG